MTKMRARVLVSGRVQGVWFRASTRRRAEELGVSGWVRNLPDGRVEAEFVGEEQAVRDALSFVAVGPEHARVDRVEGGGLEEVAEGAAEQSRGFRVR